MRTSTFFVTSALLASKAATGLAAPTQQLALGSTYESASLSWAQSAASSVLKAFGFDQNKHGLSSFGSDSSDKSIYELITSEPEFAQLAHVLNYSSDSTKELLKSKDKDLTFFAPLNWHHHRDHEGEDQSFGELPREVGVQGWAAFESAIDQVEAFEGDDDEHKHRHEVIRHLIDAAALYHVVRSDRSMKSSELADNSTVATQLNTGKAHPYNDGTDWRVRVGKSLLPIPAVYLNVYSRVVKPDIETSNGVVHGIKYPLLPPADVLQNLFFASDSLSTFTSALQKVGAAKYYHYHAPRNSTDKGHGINAETVFAPSNLAWKQLPIPFRLYLFSPWGEKLLGKILMLHSLPSDIFYADFVHHVHGGRKPPSHKEPVVVNDSNKTSYTFDSVLPKINGTDGEFETIDVDVYRYHLLPGGHGPLQTRVVVQGVPVIFQDVPNNNGAIHVIDKFIKPKGHPGHGLWAEVAREAAATGFGTVDLEAEFRADLW